MRCTACNRLFYPSKKTARDGTVTFEELCGGCKYPGNSGLAYSFEPTHGCLEDPTVRLAIDNKLTVGERY